MLSFCYPLSASTPIARWKNENKDLGSGTMQQLTDKLLLHFRLGWAAGSIRGACHSCFILTQLMG